MTPHGQRQIDAAKADGRWDAAYAPQRATNASTIPADLRAAIDANRRARKTFGALNRQNLFALVFRTNAMRTPGGRAKKIAALVAMLARGDNPSQHHDPAAAAEGSPSAVRRTSLLPHERAGRQDHSGFGRLPGALIRTFGTEADGP